MAGQHMPPCVAHVRKGHKGKPRVSLHTTQGGNAPYIKPRVGSAHTCTPNSRGQMRWVPAELQRLQEALGARVLYFALELASHIL